MNLVSGYIHNVSANCARALSINELPSFCFLLPHVPEKCRLNTSFF